MSIVPYQPTFGSGATLRTSDLNQLRDGVNYIYMGMPHVYAVQMITPTSITASTWTTVGFDTVEADTDAGLDSSGTYHCQTGGWWLVSANVAFDNPTNSTTGNRGSRLVVNGLAAYGFLAGSNLCPVETSFIHGAQLMNMVHMNVGDQLQVQGWQDTSAAINTALNFKAAQNRSETSFMSAILVTADPQPIGVQ